MAEKLTKDDVREMIQIARDYFAIKGAPEFIDSRIVAFRKAGANHNEDMFLEAVKLLATDPEALTKNHLDAIDSSIAQHAIAHRMEETSLPVLAMSRIRKIGERFDATAYLTPVGEFRAMVREVLAERQTGAAVPDQRDSTPNAVRAPGGEMKPVTPAFVRGIIEEGPQERGRSPDPTE